MRKRTIVNRVQTCFVLLSIGLAGGPAQADAFRIKMNDAELIRFEDDGDIVLSRGWIVEHARLHEWTSELRAQDGVKELVVRHCTDGTPDDDVVALLDEERGNLYLRGQAQQVANLQADGNENELVIQSGGFVRAVIDENGNLQYRGSVTEGAAATLREDLAGQYATFGYTHFIGNDDYTDLDDAGETLCYKFVDDDTYVDPGNFSFSELSCSHTVVGHAHGEWQWNGTVARMFQAVRDQYGSRIDVTSAFRCPAHNAAIGGAANSKHCVGRAFDFKQRDPDNNWAPFPEPAGYEDLSLANWAVALAAEDAGVDPRRILLYSGSGGSESLQSFYDNDWTPQVDFPNDLPSGWARINNGHCDSGNDSDMGTPPAEAR